MVAFLHFALIDFSFHLHLCFDGVKRGMVTSNVAVVALTTFAVMTTRLKWLVFISSLMHFVP